MTSVLCVFKNGVTFLFTVVTKSQPCFFSSKFYLVEALY